MRQKNQQGFTLLALMLLLVALAAAITIGINYNTQKTDELYRDKAAMQIQQILNAGLSYYLSNGAWPTTGTPTSPEELSSDSKLVSKGFLLTTPVSPWSNGYYIANNTTNGADTFEVITTTNTATEAVILAGRLPMATVAGSVVTAQVNVPGQNLANARSFNFTSLYHSGACVPVPSCPPGTSPQIVAAPSAANGMYLSPVCTDANDPSTCPKATANTLAMTGITASAMAPASVDGSQNTGPNDCISGNPAACPQSITTTQNNYACPASSTFNYQDGFSWTGTGTSGIGNTCCPALGVQIYQSGNTWVNSFGPDLDGVHCNAGYTNNAFQSSVQIQALVVNKVATPETVTTYIQSGTYWRVCLNVTTSQGIVRPNFAAWGEMAGSVFVATRCVPNNEPAGSNFKVFDQ